MNNLKTLVAACLAENENFRFVSVSFNQSDAQSYTYFSLVEGVEEGDLVVVNAAKQAKVARVTAVHEFEELELSENIDYKWIIQKVDTEFHDKCIEMQRNLVRKIKSQQREHLRKNLLESLGNETSSEVKKLVRL